MPAPVKDDQKELWTSLVQQWLAENRECLPVTAGLWETEIIYGERPVVPKAHFGAYRSELSISAPFFKPFSKILKSLDP